MCSIRPLNASAVPLNTCLAADERAKDKDECGADATRSLSSQSAFHDGWKIRSYEIYETEHSYQQATKYSKNRRKSKNPRSFHPAAKTSTSLRWYTRWEKSMEPSGVANVSTADFSTRMQILNSKNVLRKWLISKINRECAEKSPVTWLCSRIVPVAENNGIKHGRSGHIYSRATFARWQLMVDCSYRPFSKIFRTERWKIKYVRVQENYIGATRRVLLLSVLW